MNIWITADHHFGHANIIKFAKRPFASVEEMDEVMIARCNARDHNSDTESHVGDFAFAEKAYYLDRLNGQKRLVLGSEAPLDHDNLPGDRQTLDASPKEIKAVLGCVLMTRTRLVRA
jgi:calcineurin-like phosphoesterase family protein